MSNDLSPQEMRILKLIAMGYENYEIYTTLRIGRTSLHNHLKEIRNKTGITNRALLAFYAFGKGIITQGDIKAAIARDRKRGRERRMAANLDAAMKNEEEQ